ncbi:MAG TPA: hypothetical protein VN640_07085, partial [Sphingomicrobium sp.]|nr:hypothetical protein [Sphingomicrobium sp.]
MAFPTPVRRRTHVGGTSNNTAYSANTGTATLNTAIAAGERVKWVMVVAHDGTLASDPTEAAWVLEGRASEAGGAVSISIWTKETTTAFGASAFPSFSMTNPASEQYSSVMLAYKVAAGASVGFLISSSAQGSSTNSDPPSLSNGSGAAQDVIVIATRAGDSTTVATVAPTNYTDLQTATGGGTNGASANTAERQINIASGGSENPGTFTSATEQWASFTVGVYEIAAGGTLSGSGTGAASIAGGSISEQAPTLAGVGAMSPAGQAIAAATFSGSAAGALSANGGYLASGVLSGAAAGAFSFSGPELVTNGTFPSSTTGWGPSEATLSVVASRMRVTATSSSGPTGIQTVTGLTVSSNYRFSGEQFLGNTADKARFTFTGAAGSFNRDLATYGSPVEFTFAAATTAFGISCMVGSAVAFGNAADYADFDNISLKEVTAAAQGQSVATGALSASATAALSVTGQAAPTGSISSTGTAAANLTGRAIAAGAFSGAGIGATSEVGSATSAATLTGAGLGAFGPARLAIEAATLAGSSIGALNGAGQATSTAVLSAASGLGALSTTGQALASAALAAAAAGGSPYEGRALVPVAFSAAGSSSFAADNNIVVNGSL